MPAKSTKDASPAAANDSANAAPAPGRAGTRPAKVRRANGGDIAPAATAQGIGRFVVSEAVAAAQQAKIAAVRDVVQHARSGDMTALADSLAAILAGAAPDDADALRSALLEQPMIGPQRSPDEELAPGWREGGYPYKNLLTRKNYEKQKYRLQVERLNAMRYVLHKLPYANKDIDGIGPLDPLLVGRAHVVYERGENRAGSPIL
jgi:hypothetical protein